MANTMMLKTPIFAKAPTVEVLQRAVATGGALENRDRIAYVLVENTSKLYHVAMDGTLTAITGDSPEYVMRVDTLPSTSTAQTNVLYAVGNIVYSFDGTAFHPTYEALQNSLNEYKEEVDAEILEIRSALSAMQESIEALDAKVDSAVDDLNDKIDDAVETLDSKIDTAVDEINNELDTKADKATTLEGYGISDAYTSNQIDTMLGDMGGESVVEFVSDSVSTAISDAMELNIVLGEG